MSRGKPGRLLQAILVGGSITAVLDGLNSVVMFRLLLGLDAMQIYQFVASGLLGPAAYSGGIGSALLGLFIHCMVSFGAATTFTVASTKWRGLLRRPALTGSVFGIGVYAVMNYVVIPLSAIGPSPFSLPLFINGVVGHTLFVGLPIAYTTRRYLFVSNRDLPRNHHGPNAGPASTSTVLRGS